MMVKYYRREDVAKYMHELIEERGKAIAKGAIDYARKMAKIAAVG